MAKRDAERLARTEGLSGFLPQERTRLFSGASEERREQMRAAERRREVLAAWNAVCANTREGSHVTGLKYLPESNELLVYAEAGSWATELAMMREIIRARMAVHGVDIDGLIFKTSRDGYTGRPRVSTAAQAGLRKKKAPAPHADLSASEVSRLNASVAAIKDARLKEALKNAMRASFEWKRGSDDLK